MEEKSSFGNFKQQVLEENEKKFGDEIREKYGDEAAKTSTNIIMGLTEENWNRSEMIRKEYEAILRRAVEEKLSFDDETVIRMCRLHGEWISLFWGEGVYSPEAHKTLAEVYASDERFQQYYENIAVGATEFLSKAIIHYCESIE